MGIGDIFRIRNWIPLIKHGIIVDNSDLYCIIKC